MICHAVNDLPRLQPLSTVARALVRLPLVRGVARRLGSKSAVAWWLRSLPEGEEARAELAAGEHPWTIVEKVRLFPRDPNDVERAVAALVLLEALEPATARMLVTVYLPTRWSELVEACHGRWLPLDLRARDDLADEWRAQLGWGQVLRAASDFAGKPISQLYFDHQPADLVGEKGNAQ